MPADEEGGNVAHDKAQAVQDHPAYNNPLEPCPALADRPIVFAEVHEQQGDGSGDDPGDGGNAEDLVVNVLHNDFCLIPYSGRGRGRGGPCWQAEQYGHTEDKYGCKQVFPPPRTDAGWRWRMLWMADWLFQSDNLPDSLAARHVPKEKAPAINAGALLTVRHKTAL